MERDTFLQTLRHIFSPMTTYEPRPSADRGFLDVVCLTISIDGKVTDAEVTDALQLLEQLHPFQEYDEATLKELIGSSLQQLKEDGFDPVLERIKTHLTEEHEREIAFKMAAFLSESDGRVVPIEGALLQSLANLFAYDADRIHALLDALYAELDALKAAQNEPQTAENNPFLAHTALPRFQEVSARHLVPATKTLLAELEAELTELEANATPTWSGIVEPLERINARISFLWGLAHHLLGVRNEPALREAFQIVQPQVIAFSIRMGQSLPIYKVLEALSESSETLDTAQQRIVTSLVRQAQHSGVGLEGDVRERFNKIQEELARLGTQYSNNVLDSVKAFELILTQPSEVEGVPESVLALYAKAAEEAGHEGATAEDGPWRITLDIPSVFPFLRHGRQRDIREKLYLAYLHRGCSGGFDNTPLIDQILTLREEEASILGYDNFAALSLSSKMASDVGAIYQLFEELRTGAYDNAEKEHEDLKAFAYERGFEPDAELEHWDLNYWSEREREALYEYNEEELRQYFPFPVVLHGMFALFEDLFGVSIKKSEEDVATWHDDVDYYEVFDNTGALCASFFLDPYSRPGEKRSGAWHSGAWGRSATLGLNGQVRNPVSYIVCNQTPPIDGKVSLMRFGEVTTLFHEFGHGLQHMLTKVDYSMAAGISGIEWDAVELPSQFMENWCYQADVLKGMTSHVDTGEPLPPEFVEKMLQARNYRAGTAMLRQLYYATIDMTLHDEYDPASEETPFDVQRRVAERNSIVAPHAEDRFLCSFQHIFSGGYSAGYYSYKWAEVLSADAFSAFEEAGLEDHEARAATGRRFRDTVLSRGGGQDPMEVFAEFRGREPSTEPLLRHSGLSGAAE